MSRETVQSATGSDIGRTRQTNQDHVGIFEPVSDSCQDCLYVLCDGMGAYQGGETASKLAVEEIANAYQTMIDRSPIKETLQAAIRQAHAAIQAKAKMDQGLHEMGTTVVLVLIHGDAIWVANVGDSRAYLVRDHQIRQLSVDHSQVDAMVQTGMITKGQAQKHSRRNILTSALSAAHAPAEPEISRVTLRTGDAFVLCSDGLWGQVDDRKIQSIVQKYQPEQAVKNLIALANRAGGDDNISVIIVQNGILPGKKHGQPYRLERVLKNPWLVSLLVALLLAVAVLAVFALILMAGSRP